MLEELLTGQSLRGVHPQTTLNHQNHQHEETGQGLTVHFPMRSTISLANKCHEELWSSYSQIHESRWFTLVILRTHRSMNTAGLSLHTLHKTMKRLSKLYHIYYRKGASKWKCSNLVTFEAENQIFLNYSHVQNLLGDRRRLYLHETQS